MSKKNPYPWSFSKTKSFDTCAKQFYHLKVAKTYVEKETEAMLYGSAYHKAAELYIRDCKPLPEEFAYTQKLLDRLKRMKGDKLCEWEMGLTANLEACEFDAEDVWWRGIVDLLVLNRDKQKATVFDYKTGRNMKYADKGQLELMALATFIHFPKVQTVKAALLFVVIDGMVDAEYHRDDIPRLWDKWLNKYKRMEVAFKTDVWNPNPSGLCRKHCPVLLCSHNGRNE